MEASPIFLIRCFRSPGRALLAAGALLVLTLVAAEIAHAVRSTASLGSGWGVAVWSFAAAAVLALAWLLAREIRGWHCVERLSRIAGSMDGRTAADQARVRRWARGLPDAADVQPHMASWSQAVSDHDAAAARSAIEELLRGVDGLVEREIRRECARTGVLVMLSGIPILDAGLCMWRNARIMRRIATCYGARPGAAGSIRILRMVLVHAVAIDVSQHAADLLSTRIGSVAATGGQGLVAATLTARIGLWTQHVCRPLPMPRRSVVGFAAASVVDEVASQARRTVGRAARFMKARAEGRAAAN